MLVEMEQLHSCLLKDLESCEHERDIIKHMNSLRSVEEKSEKNEPPITAPDAVFSSAAANNYQAIGGEEKSEKNEHSITATATDAVFSSAVANYYQAIGGERKVEKNEPPITATATDAVFSSAAANNYYLAIGYKMGNGSNTGKNNDGLPIKNNSRKGLRGDNSVDNSTIKSEENGGGKSVTSLQEIMAYVTKKGKEPAEVAEYLKNVDKSANEADNRQTEKLLAEAEEKNKFYTDIVKFLMKAEEKKRKEEEDKAALLKRSKKIIKRGKKTKTPTELSEQKGSRKWKMNESFVRDAMKQFGKTPAENIQQIDEERKEQESVEQELEREENDYLVEDTMGQFCKTAEEARRKEEEDKTALLKRPKKLIEYRVKETKTPTELAEPLDIQEEKKASSERKMNESLVRDAMKRGAKTPAEIAAHLLQVDEERKTQELVEQALKVSKSPKEIADYLMNAAKENQKEDETVQEQESSKELVTNTPTELAEPLDIQEEKKVSSERKVNESLVRDAMKRGAKTPAEIAANLLQIDEERKTQELVEQALKVSKSPKEIADYLMNAAKENQREDETVQEQESSKELVNDTPKKGVIRSDAGELKKVGKDKKSQARPKSSAKVKRTFRPPVESLECHLADGEMSTTSTVTDHLKSVRSIDSAMSSECSIMTEIVNPNEDMDYSSRAVSQNKEMKSLTRVRGLTVSFAEGTKETSQSKHEKKHSSKMAATDKTSENIVAAKKDDGEAQFDVSQSPSGNPDDTPCSGGVQLISEELNEESQEITLDAFYAGYIEESHSLSDDSSVRNAVKEEDANDSSVRDVVEEEDANDSSVRAVVEEEDTNDSSVRDFVEEEDKEGQKNSNCIGKVEKGEHSTSEIEKCEVYEENNSKSAAPLKSKMKRILAFKKKSSRREIVNQKTEKNSSKKIAKHQANSSEDASGATESSSSNESISSEQKYVKNKVVEFDLDGPITSISIPAKDPAIYDEVTLPTVLRKKSKVDILNEHRNERRNEPAVLDEWWSDMSILDDDRTGYSGHSVAHSQYTIDPFAVMDEDDVEEKWTCNEVKEYKDEIGLIACEVRDFCSTTARKASALLGFDSERRLSKSINTAQAEEPVVERKKNKRMMQISEDESDEIEICLARPRKNELQKKKRSFNRLGLRKSTRCHI